MGAVYQADPVRRSVTAAVSAVLAVLTVAAGAYFALAAARGAPDPRPAMQTALDRLKLPSGATLLSERVAGGVICDDTGCPTVERWWAIPGTVEQLCPATASAVAEAGGIRFQRLGSADCGFVGILGAYRLSFSVEDSQSARLHGDLAAPASGTVVHVALTRP